jgi:hypothetical protein
MGNELSSSIHKHSSSGKKKKGHRHHHDNDQPEPEASCCAAGGTATEPPTASSSEAGNGATGTTGGDSKTSKGVNFADDPREETTITSNTANHQNGTANSATNGRPPPNVGPSLGTFGASAAAAQQARPRTTRNGVMITDALEDVSCLLLVLFLSAFPHLCMFSSPSQ